MVRTRAGLCTEGAVSCHFASLRHGIRSLSLEWKWNQLKGKQNFHLKIMVEFELKMVVFPNKDLFQI